MIVEDAGNGWKRIRTTQIMQEQYRGLHRLWRWIIGQPLERPVEYTASALVFGEATLTILGDPNDTLCVDVCDRENSSVVRIKRRAL